MDIQPYTDRIRFNKRIESEDIRYPHFSGDSLTDCIYQAPQKRPGYEAKHYVLLFSTTQPSQQHFFKDARSQAQEKVSTRASETSEQTLEMKE